MALYELLILGSPTPAQLATLDTRAKETASDFNLLIPDEFAIRVGPQVATRDPKASSVALYFGGDPTIDAVIVDELEAVKIPIIPVVPAGATISTTVPVEIHKNNAFFLLTNDDLAVLTTAGLECLGLLRQQRRVFISYRRIDSREVAVQLHDHLAGSGFDVFLDTHDIRPGEPFQEMLWHRLADCDVVIMLDTPKYFESKWTKQELGRTLAKGIHILRIIWPGHSSSRHLTLSDTITLQKSNFDSELRLTPDTVDTIARKTETLRSRSVATRHRDIAGKFRVEVERIGGVFEGIGLHRSMAITLANGTKVCAFPAVGVPTADLLNDVHSKAKEASYDGTPCLVYDHIGIRDKWLDHLKWLDEQIATVKAIKVFDAAWELTEWDS